MVIADTLGEKEKGLEYCSDLQRVLAWLPIEWGVLEKEAFKCLDFYGEESPMYRVWGEVQSAFISMALQEANIIKEDEVIESESC